MPTMLLPSTLAMELLHSTQAMLPQTLRALAVPRMTAMQPQPQRIAMAHPPWTLDTELLLQATRDPQLQLLLPMRSLRLITITRTSRCQLILVRVPVPDSQTMLPQSLLIPLMLPVLPTVHHLPLRKSTMTHLAKLTTRRTCCQRTTMGFTTTDQLARTTRPLRQRTATEPQLRQGTGHQRQLQNLRLVATVTLRPIFCQNISSPRSHSV